IISIHALLAEGDSKNSKKTSLFLTYLAIFGPINAFLRRNTRFLFKFCANIAGFRGAKLPGLSARFRFAQVR
ncbi:MAG: hypothetical protein ACI3W8_01255, partial [Oscillospiraceae bacterium]